MLFFQPYRSAQIWSLDPYPMSPGLSSNSYSNVPFLLVFIQSKSHLWSWTQSTIPSLPPHLSLHPSAQFSPRLSLLNRHHRWNNTHPSLCLSALTPRGEKSSIYLVFPCFAITSPLCNPSFHPSSHPPPPSALSSVLLGWQRCRPSAIISAKVVPVSIHLTQAYTINPEMSFDRILLLAQQDQDHHSCCM